MFKAKSNCIIESIGREDFFRLARKYYQLSDQLELINEKFDENETNFDFFRFRAKRRLPDEVRKLVRKKFRVALSKFIRKFKNGEVELPRALILIKEFQTYRLKKNEEINTLKGAGIGAGPTDIGIM